MELSITHQHISNLPHHHHHQRRFEAKPILFNSRISLPLIKSTLSLRNPGLNDFVALPRAGNCMKEDHVDEPNVVYEAKFVEVEEKETPPMSESWQEAFEFLDGVNMKKTRNELSSQIEDLKQKVIGFTDN